MSILVDARGLLASGIGRYLREVLAGVFADPRFARIRLLGAPEPLRDFCAGQPDPERASIHAYPHGFYSPAAQAAWLRVRATGQARADVAFFPHYDVPLLGFPARSVVTVHDLIHFKVPQAFSSWRRLGAGVLLRGGVSAASRILTVSESTRRDLVERFPAAAGRIRVVPNGVGSFFRPSPEEELPGIPAAPPFLLCVGNRKPHKNLGAAVDALAILAGERPDLRLVVVGEVFSGWAAVLARAEARGVRHRVAEVPAPTDAQLRALYSRCEALLFPSLYEGFGLPVLEAMACGAPVVVSNRSSLPEVVGDAGLLVDPEDPRAMADAVRLLHHDPRLRADLVRRGLERAREFGWERSVKAVVDELHAVGLGAGPLEA